MYIMFEHFIPGVVFINARLTSPGYHPPDLGFSLGESTFHLPPLTQATQSSANFEHMAME